MSKQIKVGDRVRLTRKFLRSTGQTTSPDGSRRWTVIGIQRDWAIVDQLGDTSFYTGAELRSDPSLQYRRIALANLEEE